MIGGTKSVGTSTSSITPNSITSSPTRTSFSSIRVDSFKAKLKPIGFFPSYVPDSIAETNALADSSDPPPYPVDSPLHSQDPPPYPIDELSYGKDLPFHLLRLADSNAALNLPYPTKISSANPLEERAGPSAPTICELNHKLGLIPTEREEIIDTLLQMKRAVEGKTELERTEFLDAQKKLKELLFAAQARLTEADKEEFINEAKKIKKIKIEKELERHNQEKQEQLRKAADRRRECQIKEEEEANDCYCDLWSISFKGFQLAMVILTYAEIKKMLNDNEGPSTQLLILLCFVAIMFTACLLIFYSFGRRPARSMLKAECIYCGFCMFAIFIASLPQIRRSIHVLLFDFGAFTGYGLDLIRIFCLLRKKTNSQNSNNNDDQYQYSPTRGGSYDSNAHSRNKLFMTENVVATVNHWHSTNITDETILNLDFLDDSYHEINSSHQTHSHNNISYNDFRADDNISCHNNSDLPSSSYLPTNSAHHSNSNHHTSNPDHITSSECQFNNNHQFSNDNHTSSYDYGGNTSCNFGSSSDYGGGDDCGGDDTGGDGDD